MKTLYIIRHAKSSWKDVTLDDFDRPLNKRGKLNAPMMGKRLEARKIKPDLILSSPANRAKATAEMIAKEVKYSKQIVFREDIYESDYLILHKILQKEDDKNSILFLCGHNSELNMLIEKYIDFEENVVTCGIIEIEFHCKEWKDIGSNNAKFLSYDYPKKEIK